MRVAQTGGGDIGLRPSQIDQDAIEQRGDIASQAVTGGSQEAPGGSSPIAFFRASTSSCRARGATPYPAQKGAQGSPPSAPPPAPGSDGGGEEEEPEARA
jgi:hypothetical protein